MSNSQEYVLEENGRELEVKFRQLDPCAILPARQSTEASGMDLSSVEDVLIPPGDWAVVGCGFSMSMPKGIEAQVRPRSGLAAKSGVTVLNSPGTIDSDYRGEVKVILINHGKKPVKISKCDRIAQMILAPCIFYNTTTVTDLDDTERGEGGFGSTGR